MGKTAVAEGIAQLIVSPAAPLGLRGRALIALDVGSLVAGTQYRGAFEERLTVSCWDAEVGWLLRRACEAMRCAKGWRAMRWRCG